MKSKLRLQVEALPPEQRLEYALSLIDELTNDESAAGSDFKSAYGLTKREGEIVEFLNGQFPKVVTKGQLLTRLYGLEDTCPGMVIIDVFIARIRKKGVEGVQTVWGEGYRLAGQLWEGAAA